MDGRSAQPPGSPASESAGGQQEGLPLTAARRCAWAGSAPEYVAYHDDEWGRPLHGVVPLFERLSLEGFQSGLSWLVILRKRAGFRSAFAGFDPVAVAAFGPDDVARLLADAGIVRNRAKIEATVHNARRVLDLDRPLDELLWSFAPAVHPRPATLADVPATSPKSVAMAKELKRRGLRFVGPTTCYALMQAAGLVDDHVSDCWRADPPVDVRLDPTEPPPGGVGSSATHGLRSGGDFQDTRATAPRDLLVAEGETRRTGDVR